MLYLEELRLQSAVPDYEMKNSRVGASPYSEAAVLKNGRKLIPGFAFSTLQGLIIDLSISHYWLGT